MYDEFIIHVVSAGQGRRHNSEHPKSIPIPMVVGCLEVVVSFVAD